MKTLDDGFIEGHKIIARVHSGEMSIEDIGMTLKEADEIMHEWHDIAMMEMHYQYSRDEDDEVESLFEKTQNQVKQIEKKQREWLARSEQEKKTEEAVKENTRIRVALCRARKQLEGLEAERAERTIQQHSTPLEERRKRREYLVDSGLFAKAFAMDVLSNADVLQEGMPF